MNRKWIAALAVMAVMLGFIFMQTTTEAATPRWEDSFDECPIQDTNEFPGFSCPGGNDGICGVDGTAALCYDKTLMDYPSVIATSSTQWTSGEDGGYVVNCYTDMDAASPYCDNSTQWWCNRDTTCHSDSRYTNCTPDSTAFTCSTCYTGYTYCDGSYTDANGCEIDIDTSDCSYLDGGVNGHNQVDDTCTCVCDSGWYDCDAGGASSTNGCEIDGGTTPYPSEPNAHYEDDAGCGPECDLGYIDCDLDLGTGGTGCEIEDGGDCAVGQLSGTYSGCSCVVATSTFQTGVLAEFLTSNPLLWGYQYGDGPLMDFTSWLSSTTGGVFHVANDGKVGIGTSSPSSMLTVGIDSGSQFLVNATGTVTAGTWQGSAIGLDYGGLGGDFSGETGFLYVSGGATVASNTIDITKTNLSAGSGINYNNNVISLNTGGDWGGTFDTYEATDFFLLSDWLATTSAPQLTDLANLSQVGTIATGTWEGDIIDVAYGGTGSSTWTQYTIPYLSTSDAFGQIKIGSSSQLLAVNSGGTGYEWIDTGSVGLDTNDKVAVHAGETAGYLGASSGDGVLHVSSPLSYTDGGAYITIGLTTNSLGNEYLTFDTGQHLTATSSPTFAGLTLTNFGNGIVVVSNGVFGTTSNNIANWDAVYASSTYYDLTYASSTIYDAVYASSTAWDTAYAERGSQIAGDYLNWDGSELDVTGVFSTSTGAVLEVAYGGTASTT
ncbi:MAG: hypothetical protein U9M89_02500, partial [Patescibacteria group bacterium]|nr:hypothetical protein [Patescibacteria group bacterium]